VGKKNHHGGIKGTKFKFTSRGLDVVFPNRTDHYFPHELLAYTEEGKNKFLPQEGKQILSIGVGIGQTTRQGPIARPTKSPARPSSFNKWVILELFKKPINLIRPGLGL
jgi:hypothetical protein